MILLSTNTKTTDQGQHIPTKEHKIQAILTLQNWKHEELPCLPNTFTAAEDTLPCSNTVPKHSHHTHKRSHSLASQAVGQPCLEPLSSQLSLSDSWLAPCSCWLFSSLYGSCPITGKCSQCGGEAEHREGKRSLFLCNCAL